MNFFRSLEELTLPEHSKLGAIATLPTKLTLFAHLKSRTTANRFLFRLLPNILSFLDSIIPPAIKMMKTQPLKYIGNGPHMRYVAAFLWRN
jgi:hypothetical protein